MKIAYFTLESGEVNHVATVAVDDIAQVVDFHGKGKVEVPDDFDESRSWVDPITHEIRHYSTDGAFSYRNVRRAGFVWSPAHESWTDDRQPEQAKGDAWEQVKRIRSSMLAARRVSDSGVPYSVSKDQSALASVIDGLGEGSEFTVWRDMDNIEWPMNGAELTALAAQIAAAKQAVMEHSWMLDRLIRAATTTQEVAAINVLAEWP